MAATEDRDAAMRQTCRLRWSIASGLFVFSSFRGARGGQASLPSFLFCLGRSPGVEAVTRIFERTEVFWKRRVTCGLDRHQCGSSLLPRLQGSTSLEILIKEASGCLILMLDSLSQPAAMPSASFSVPIPGRAWNWPVTFRQNKAIKGSWAMLKPFTRHGFPLEVTYIRRAFPRQEQELEM